MSGICGIWEYGAGEAVALDTMLAALAGCETDLYREAGGRGSVALGWRGGAIGEWNGAERPPRLGAASGLAVASSARLDGRDALCETLGVPRVDGARLPDRALILKSYARWGRACPEHLLGDYAFALWDRKRATLFCARDHVGARPFYYAHVGDRFVFASNLEAVLAAPGVSADLDEVAVATRLSWGMRPLGARTCYREVRRLLPGHALTVERGRLHHRRWWRPEEVTPAPTATDDALAEACLEVLSEAVRDRLRGGRPVGVHLSGGLDSSGVAVLAARELRRQGRPAPSAFAWQPPPDPARSGAAAAEYGAIEAVSRQEALQVVYRPPTASDVVACLRRDGIRHDEPTLIHEEVVQRAASGDGVGVLLSGLGGDEGISFNGRGYYPELLRSGQAPRLWGELRERSRRPVAAFIATAALPLVSPRLALAARRRARGERFFRKKVTFLHSGFARRVRALPLGAGPARAGVRATQVHLLQHERLSRRMECWATSGARHGIEYTYPLLDRRLLEFALGLPPDQYRRGRWSRWLMRRALDSVLPPQVCWNTDKGDPARFESFRHAIADALPVVRGMIEGREGELSRSRYLDLPRLLAELDPERWRARERPVPVLNALRFLDF